jgi:hypothetical protein
VSPFGNIPIGRIAEAALVASVLLAVLATWPVCALLLRTYRRSIERGMRSNARATSATAAVAILPPAAVSILAPAELPAPAVQRLTPVEVPAGPQPALLGPAQRRSRRATVVFCIAGLGYGLGTSAVFHVVAQLDWQPIRVIAYTFLVGWPVLPTVLTLSWVRRRFWWLGYVGYLALVALLLALAGVNITEMVVMAVPALFVLATGARQLRGAAWLVVPGLMGLGLALLALYPVGVYVFYQAPFNRYAWWLLGVGVGLLVLVVAYGWGLARIYQTKLASDQTLLIVQWWAVTSLWWSMVLGTQGNVAALLALVPCVLFVLALLIVALVARPIASRPVRLLLLRTFGSRQRSSRLLHDLTRQWRWVGSVELITGVDLASEILEPDEFLDFLRGRLNRRFVADAASLRGRLAEIDAAPDRDGRYRVNELMCHDDTWRPAVEGLIGDVDAVLVDLRGFTAHNAGVVHELELLVALMPLQQVVALVDATTDEPSLRWALDRAASLAPASSPVTRDPSPRLRTITLGPGIDDSQRLIWAVARAATLEGGTQSRGETDHDAPTGAAPPRPDHPALP